MTPQLVKRMVENPLVFGRVLWPHVRFYDKQEEIIYSVEYNDETVVPAGNVLGKDFVSGFIALSYFLRKRECRIITTSVADRHLDVLWAEIERFVNTSKFPLKEDQGGPLKFTYREIRKKRHVLACLFDPKKCPGVPLDEFCYLQGMVAQKGEKLSGHHAEHTLAIVDEASSMEDDHYSKMIAWAKRVLLIGNCWEPQGRHFQEAVEAGDILAR